MILPATRENLVRAASLLRQGELVAMPTETVYGLAGDAFSESAVAKIFGVKERPTFDPLIVHLAPLGEGPSPIEALEEREVIAAAALSSTARARAEALMRALWPGPLTLVLPKHARVPDLVTSGLSTVAVRVPRHPVAQALLVESGLALAAPSANRFGRISPTSAEDVAAELGDRIPLILDGGRCPIGVESTVVAITDDGELTLLRPGGTTAEMIEAAAGARPRRASVALEEAAPSPGMLASHYAPRKRLLLLPGPIDSLRDGAALFPAGARPSRVALLAQAGDADERRERFARLTGCDVIARVLSPTGDREEAARALFAALRALDASAAELLFAEPCSDEHGLGHAILDRLRRAAS